jgi:phosphoribosyl 1,2-cyclic phosphate phosphodiesterase
MHLKYFGTAAAEGIPAMFCTCAVCEGARKLGGRNLRTRSQALVDGRLLIDFPPDTYMHCLHGGLDLPPITACIITHAHEDHLYAEDLVYYRLPGYAHIGRAGVPHTAPLHVYGTTKVMETLRERDKENAERQGILQLHEICAFQPFMAEDFALTALTANHAANTGPVIYCIARGGKTMLYGNDTGYFPEETWDYLAQERPRFDFVSLDCTGMAQGWRDGHMGLPANAEVRDRLTALGCADGQTKFCVHHFSHNGGLNHDQLVLEAARYGFLVSYDGMELAF